jgi:hypothetical protein
MDRFVERAFRYLPAMEEKRACFLAESHMNPGSLPHPLLKTRDFPRGRCRMNRFVWLEAG